MTRFRIAGVQMDVALGDPAANLKTIADRLEAAAAEGAQLVVFPECALTGYCFDSREEALEFAEPIPGPACDALAAQCQRLGVFVVAGLLERAEGKLFNACVLIGPDGLVGAYRKIHLPHLGVDRFVDLGDRPFSVYDAGGLRVGLNICYDSAFPESARIMALAGADLIALPTNFPPGAECMAEHMVHTRAMENCIYYACVNRVGCERGFRFIGTSKICDPHGAALCVAGGSEETILHAEIDVAKARQKKLVRVPGKHWIDRFADRRPDVYGPIVE